MQVDLPAQAGDIWAMGVTLFCMAFGQLPFNGNALLELFNSIKNEMYKFFNRADLLFQLELIQV